MQMIQKHPHSTSPNSQPRLARRAAQVSALALLAFASVATTSGIATASGQGAPTDWSHAHLVYHDPGSIAEAWQTGTLATWQATVTDPRFSLQQQRTAKTQSSAAAAAIVSPSSKSNPGAHRDWNVNLGSNIAPNMSPATYAANAYSATPSCTNDYVVYALQTNAGSSTQPTLVGFNQLYTSGTDDSSAVAAGGLCATTTLTTPKWLPRIKWSFNTRTATGGQILTSPTVSPDGTKVAFVETTATSSIFHVLTLGTGEGGVTNPSSLSVSPTVSPPVSPAPADAKGALMTSFTFATSKDSNSSPFINYTTDQALVGTDAGSLCLIKAVFTGTPDKDTSWGTTGCVTVETSATLTGAVWDTVNSAIFVGSSSGTMYAINPVNGATLHSWVPSAGSAIDDAPIVDVGGAVGAPRVYAFYGSDGGANGVAQADETFSVASRKVAVSGGNAKGFMHAGYLNDSYYSNTSPSTWRLYICGYTSGNSQSPHLLSLSFSSGPLMGTSFTDLTSGNAFVGSKVECSPMTGVSNPNGGGAGLSKEWLFVGDASGELNSWDVTGNPATPVRKTLSSAGGTSGLVIDNLASSAQASSVYFTPLGANSAIKATQNGLN